MARGILERIRRAITDGDYDVSAHALGEMADDKLGLWDLESAIFTGKLGDRQRDDLRGTQYVIHGWSADREAQVGVVCRFTETGRLLIITVYQITPPEG